MPIYEYRAECGAKTSELRKVAERNRPLHAACKCRSKRFCMFKRVLSPTRTNFVFADTRK